jgi:hypothetical protein
MVPLRLLSTLLLLAHYLSSALPQPPHTQSFLQTTDSSESSSLNISTDQPENLTSEDLIDSEKADKERELRTVNDDIDELEEEIEAQTICINYDSCASCSLSSTCVWCKSLQLCVAGDEEGATNGECSEFEYSKCSAEYCGDYNDCEACLSSFECGWCTEGYCDIVSSTTCSSDSFYYTASDTNYECTGYIIHTAKQESGSLAEKEAKLKELRDEQQAIAIQVQDLDMEAERIEYTAAANRENEDTTTYITSEESTLSEAERTASSDSSSTSTASL